MFCCFVDFFIGPERPYGERSINGMYCIVLSPEGEDFDISASSPLFQSSKMFVFQDWNRTFLFQLSIHEFSIDFWQKSSSYCSPFWFEREEMLFRIARNHSGQYPVRCWENIGPRGTRNEAMWLVDFSYWPSDCFSRVIKRFIAIWKLENSILTCRGPPLKFSILP